jgi:DNA-binding MarR family transcriptional regulator
MGATPSFESEQVAAELKIVVGRIARRLRQAHALGDMTLSEMSVLSRLDREGPATPGVLAESERVRPQAMGSTLATLEQRGLVERRPDATDKRRVVMTLNEAGRAVIQNLRSVSIQMMARAMDEEFTAAERSTLLAVVPLLDRLAERL